MAAATLVGTAVSTVGNLVTAQSKANTQKQTVRTGSLTGNNGYLCSMECYAVIRRQVLSYPYDYGEQYGYPLNKYCKLKDLCGFTQVGSIHLSNIECTNDELDEIEKLLKEGVIL